MYSELFVETINMTNDFKFVVFHFKLIDYYQDPNNRNPTIIILRKMHSTTMLIRVTTIINSEKFTIFLTYQDTVFVNYTTWIFRFATDLWYCRLEDNLSFHLRPTLLKSVDIWPRYDQFSTPITGFSEIPEILFSEF